MYTVNPVPNMQSMKHKLRSC